MMLILPGGVAIDRGITAEYEYEYVHVYAVAMPFRALSVAVMSVATRRA